MNTVYKVILLFPLIILLSCGNSQPKYEIHKLTSGKEVKVFGIGKIHFTNDDPALMLKYYTDINLDDKDSLIKEVDEIWPVFKINVESSKLNAAIISANDLPKGVIISKNRSYNFIFQRNTNGEWERTTN